MKKDNQQAVPQGRRSLWRRVIYIVFSALVTVGIFAYLLTHVRVSEVVEVIRNADRRGVAMFLVLSLAMSVFRMWRYRIVLQTAGYSPRSSALFLVVLVRNFFSDLLPARIGTVVYIYIVTTRLGVPFGAATSSFALSFLFDLIALAPMVAAAALAAGASAAVPAGVLLVSGVVLALVTVFVLAALPRMFHLVTWVLDRLVVLTHGHFRKWREAWQQAEKEIQHARAAGIYTRVFVLSLLVRVCKYGALYMFLFALIGPMGFGFARLSIPKVFLGLCSSELAASLPISGIAGFGAYEGTWAVVFELLGFPAHIAKVTSISHHLFTQVYGYSLGALALVILMLPVFRQKGMLRPTEHKPVNPWRFYGYALLTTAGVILLLVLCYMLVPAPPPGP